MFILILVCNPHEARAMNIYSNPRVESRGKLFVKVLSNIYDLYYFFCHKRMTTQVDQEFE